jgi:hypothetical protein
MKKIEKINNFMDLILIYLKLHFIKNNVSNLINKVFLKNSFLKNLIFFCF